jgi:hypothetical protein
MPYTIKCRDIKQDVAEILALQRHEDGHMNTDRVANDADGLKVAPVFQVI